MLKHLGIVQFYKAFTQVAVTILFATASFSASVFAEDQDSVKTIQPHAKLRVAVVRHVGESSRGPFVVIDGGHARGYAIGVDVCFYDDHDHETTCGTVERASPKAAGIRIERNLMSLIRVGDRVWFKGAGALPPRGASETSDQNEINKMLKEEEAEPPLLSRRWFADYSLAPSLPISVNALKFDAAARASGNGTVWSAGAVQRFSPVGFVSGVQFPRSGTTMQQIFVGYQFLPQSPVVSDYDLTDSSQTVTSNVSGHFYRLGIQIGESFMHTDSSDLIIAGGIDLGYMTHKFSAILTSGSSLASGNMRHFLISAPISTWWELHLGVWALRTGLDITIPMLLFGEKATGTIDYSEETGARKDMTAALSAINPRKSLGVALRLGIGTSF